MILAPLAHLALHAARMRLSLLRWWCVCGKRARNAPFFYRSWSDLLFRPLPENRLRWRYEIRYTEWPEHPFGRYTCSEYIYPSRRAALAAGRAAWDALHAGCSNA